MENNDKWLTIFDCAKIISDLKPWKKFNDIDFFELRQYKIDRVYVSFLGRAKQVYGVVFYRGDEIVGVDVMSIRESTPSIQRIRYQKYLFVILILQKHLEILKHALLYLILHINSVFNCLLMKNYL